ncbi:hypothetical protein GTY84_13090 [Streptomyces sp. SID8352]|nr:hypothetical protein [Streptomyces sp. SID8352]
MSLPGADELFRTTGGTALQSSTPRRPPGGGEARIPGPAGENDPAAAEDAPQSVPAQGGDGGGPEHAPAADAEQGAAGEPHSRAAERAARAVGRGPGAQQEAPAAQPRKRGRAAARRPSGRERHDEKITVYVSAEELMDLEHARLVLRGEHGLAVDRGRIVREAVAVVLADLETRGEASILVRRLRGR